MRNVSILAKTCLDGSEPDTTPDSDTAQVETSSRVPLPLRTHRVLQSRSQPDVLSFVKGRGSQISQIVPVSGAQRDLQLEARDIASKQYCTNASGVQDMGLRCALAVGILLVASLSRGHADSNAFATDISIQTGGAKSSDSMRAVCGILSEGRHIFAGSPSCSILCPAKDEMLNSLNLQLQCCPTGLCYVSAASATAEGSCQLCSSAAREANPLDLWCAPQLCHVVASSLQSSAAALLV